MRKARDDGLLYGLQAHAEVSIWAPHASLLTGSRHKQKSGEPRYHHKDKKE